MLVLILKSPRRAAKSLSLGLQPVVALPAALLLSAHYMDWRIGLIQAEAMRQPDVFRLNEWISGFTHIVDYRFVRGLNGDYWRDGIWKRRMA